MDDTNRKRGPGRPEAPPEIARKPLSTKIDPKTAKELERRRDATGKPFGVLVDEAIEKTRSDY